MKRLIGTIAVLFLFLIFAFFRSTDQAKKNQIPTVGILQLTSHPALDEIHRGIIAALSQGKTSRSIFKMPKMIKVTSNL